MSGIMKEIGVPIERRTPDPAYTGPEYHVVGEMRGMGQAHGDTVGPYQVADQDLPLFDKLLMPWGAWPDNEHPQVLYNNQGQGPTMSTNGALRALKYHAVAFGVGGLALGAAAGWFFGKKANR